MHRLAELFVLKVLLGDGSPQVVQLRLIPGDVTSLRQVALYRAAAAGRAGSISHALREAGAHHSRLPLRSLLRRSGALTDVPLRLHAHLVLA